MNLKQLMLGMTIAAAGTLFAENLVPNPDFESANRIYPNGWYAHQAAPRELKNFSTEDGVARISQASPSAINQLILSVPVANAKKVTIKIDYKLDMLQKNGGLLYHFVDQSGKRMNESRFALEARKESAEWKTFSTTVAVPAGAEKITLTLAVYGGPDCPDASFYFRNPVVEIAE